MQIDFDAVKRQLEEELKQAKDLSGFENIRVKYTGKTGSITNIQKNVDFKSLSPDEKKDFGANFNRLKEDATVLIKEAVEQFKSRQTQSLSIDLTIPGSGREGGSLHPISLVQMELEQIFQGMGFMVLEGYEVETEYYNFDSLNIPFDHPAREMQDTYWLENKMLLRTHTSANQVRAMENYGAPLKAVFPGRCFRYENVDASHENTFYQFEGLMIDTNISIAHLVAVMKALLSEVFHRQVKVRLRPGFFAFVEPGFELDINCLICGGKGCATCKHSGWVELLPCGLIHPNVLRHGKIDTEKYNGFAFGLGLTRLAMMKYNIPEIRLLNSGDLRFYSQFAATI